MAVWKRAGMISTPTAPSQEWAHLCISRPALSSTVWNIHQKCGWVECREFKMTHRHFTVSPSKTRTWFCRFSQTSDTNTILNGKLPCWHEDWVSCQNQDNDQSTSRTVQNVVLEEKEEGSDEHCKGMWLWQTIWEETHRRHWTHCKWIPQEDWSTIQREVQTLWSPRTKSSELLGRQEECVQETQQLKMDDENRWWRRWWGNHNHWWQSQCHSARGRNVLPAARQTTLWLNAHMIHSIQTIAQRMLNCVKSVKKLKLVRQERWWSTCVTPAVGRWRVKHWCFTHSEKERMGWRFKSWCCSWLDLKNWLLTQRWLFLWNHAWINGRKWVWQFWWWIFVQRVWHLRQWPWRWQWQSEWNRQGIGASSSSTSLDGWLGLPFPWLDKRRDCKLRLDCWFSGVCSHAQQQTRLRQLQD